ncbi:MAG: hypothetical protein WCH78_11320, partial [Bacteroidota bacterium]
MKQTLLILFSLFIVGIAFGQTDSIKKTEEAETSKTTIIVPVKKVILPIDTSKINIVLADSAKIDSLRKDSLVTVSVKPVLVQETDTLTYQKYYTSAWLPFEKV